MRIPPYWARGDFRGTDQRGREALFSSWGWSFESAEAARTDGEEKARRAFEIFSSGGRVEAYHYLDRPLREESVETFGDAAQPAAMITRNRYGSLVLNTTSVCFVDVDFPPPQSEGLIDAVLMLFSASRRRQRAEAAREATVRAVRDWIDRNPTRSVRLYRTAAGLRLLLTDKLYDPTSEEVARLFDELGTDMLYRRLTVNQACFRARLTPKPWRCGCSRPPNQYPRLTPEQESSYHAWLSGYERNSASCATCRLLDTFGPDSADATIASLVRLHDEMACGRGASDLA
ncbi:MAG: hypothetical protein JW818_14500 [Pirellulales bacterium]|nr:hypothetical protein [Pirellulales bacterium]